MKALRIIIPFILATIAVCFAASGCGRFQLQHKRVLIVYSYDSVSNDYKEHFNKSLDQQFRQNGYRAEITEKYLDLTSLNDGKWRSTEVTNYHNQLDLDNQGDLDAIFVVGDFAASFVMDLENGEHSEHTDSVLKHVPVIIGDMHYADNNTWKYLRRFGNVAGLEAPIDYVRNLNLAVELSGINHVEIELDYHTHDSIIRSQLYPVLSRSPYVNDCDHHILNLNFKTLADEWKDSIVVLGVSAENPDRNYNPIFETVGADGQIFTNNITTHCWNYPHLNLKKDVYWDYFISRTRKPQFTAIPARFADGRATFLCGYFASYETVASDMVGYARRVWTGTPPANIPVGQHHQDYYMDYDAMQRLGLKYSDYHDDGTNLDAHQRFNIVGAPLYVANPLHFYLRLGAIALLVAIVISILTATLYRYRNRAQRSLEQQLLHQREIHKLALAGSNSGVWTYQGGTFRFNEEFCRQNRMPYNSLTIAEFHAISEGDTKVTATRFLHSTLKPGIHQVELLLRFSSSDTPHWWQVRYIVDPTQSAAVASAIDRVERQLQDGQATDVDPVEYMRVLAAELDESFVINGLIIDYDKSMARKKRLEEAYDMVEKAKTKESFLNNMSHEIRTPLNSIMGFAQLLTEMGDELTEQERADYANYINTSASDLMILVNNILEFSRLEAGKAVITNGLIDIKQLLDDLNGLWSATVPAKFEVYYQPGRPGTFAIGDKRRIEQIIEQFINNSIKFTSTEAKTTITLGWQYSLSRHEVDIWVEDCGDGIPENEQELVFNIFFKRDEYSPGTGLGLPIASTLAKAMGGHIGVESEVGVGSRFTLTLRGQHKQPEAEKTAPAEEPTVVTAEAPALVEVTGTPTEETSAPAEETSAPEAEAGVTETEAPAAAETPATADEAPALTDEKTDEAAETDAQQP